MKSNDLIAFFNKRLSSLNPSHYKRKFLALYILIDYIEVEDILLENKTLIYDLLTSSGDIHLASSNYLFEKIVTKLLEKQKIIDKKLNDTTNQDKKLDSIAEISKYWLEDYLRCLEKEEFYVVKGIIANINPLICKINKNITTYLIQAILKKDLTRKNILWCYVSLLKLARDNGLIEYSAKNSQDAKSYQFKATSSSVQGNLLDVVFLKVCFLFENCIIKIDN